MDVAAKPSEPPRAATPPLLEALAVVLERRGRDYPEVDAPSKRRAAGVLALFYERAGEPKKLVVLPIEHYDIYAGKWFDESARLAREWFERFLK